MNERRFRITTGEVRKRAADAVRAITGADNAEVVIRPYEDDQTAAQRGFFHVLAKILADEIGLSPNDMKQVIKVEAWGSHTVTAFGVTTEVVKTSSGAKKDEYSELIECVYRIGAENGIVLPNPRWAE